MERVAIYCRVSGQEQLKEGYSLAEQESRLRMYCEAQGWHVHDAYVDGAMTGSNMDRPALQQMIRAVEHGEVTKVCVYKLDRLSRSQKDTMYLIEDVLLKNHVDFVSMSETLDTSTPLGMAMIGILSVFAQLERSNIKERMTMGRDARAKSGKWKGSGSIPFGYDRNPNGGLMINEYDAHLVRMIFDQYLKGKTCTAISTDMKKLKPSARTWQAARIKDIISQPLYIGLQRWKGEIIPVHDCPPIIDEETFNAAQEELKRRSQKNDHPVTQQQHVTLFGGMVWCGKCGRRYMAFKDMSGGRKPVRRLYCVSKLNYGRRTGMIPCGNSGIRSDKLEEIVIGEIKKVSLDPSLIMGDTVESITQTRSAISSRIAEINKQLDKLVDLYTIDGIDIQTLSKRSQSLKSERNALTDQLNNLSQSQEETRKNHITYLSEFRTMTSSESYDPMSLYDIVRKLIKSITITDNNIDIDWNL